MEASALRVPAGLSRRPGAVRLRLRSDDQLVALFRLGNEESFRVIHDRYRARLLAYCRQMLAGTPAEAEDALQDVFLRAYGALRADDRPVTLRAWLYRVAHNRCIDQLRRPGTVELFDNVRLLHGTGADPIAEVVRRDELRRLVADVDGLPVQQRSALLMRELEGMTYNELAGALSVSVPAVKSLLVRARMGLTDAQAARDTSCGDIRTDLIAAYDRGVRASGRSRRHLRECSSCRDYRRSLRALQAPSSRLGALLGIGGSGAAAGGGAAASSGAIFGGGVAAATATKVAAAVCCAAVLGGGAVEASHQLQAASPPVHRAATHQARTVIATAPATVIRAVSDMTRRAGAAEPAARSHVKALAPPHLLKPATPLGDVPQLATLAPADATDAGPPTGGVLAPDADAADLATATTDAPGTTSASPDTTTSTSTSTPGNAPSTTDTSGSAAVTGSAATAPSDPVAPVAPGVGQVAP